NQSRSTLAHRSISTLQSRSSSTLGTSQLLTAISTPPKCKRPKKSLLLLCDECAGKVQPRLDVYFVAEDRQKSNQKKTDGPEGFSRLVSGPSRNEVSI